MQHISIYGFQVKIIVFIDFYKRRTEINNKKTIKNKMKIHYILIMSSPNIYEIKIIFLNVSNHTWFIFNLYKVEKVYKTRPNLQANPKLGRDMNRDPLPNGSHS